MSGFEQLDLFGDTPSLGGPSPVTPTKAVTPESLSDEALISTISEVSLRDADEIAAEVGRRRLAAAVPALEKLCNGLTGYGASAPVTEQIAALRALGEIGGADAAQAVIRMIARKVVQGPTLASALTVAAQLGVALARDLSSRLLRDPSASVRVAACGCARAGAEVIARLLEGLNDSDAEFAVASACALGRMGRSEACTHLKRHLLERPSQRIIEALARVADEEAIVYLARTGRARPELTEVVLAALEEIEGPRAQEVLGALTRALRLSS